MTQLTELVTIAKGPDVPSLLRPVDIVYPYIGDCYVYGMLQHRAANSIDEFSAGARDGKPLWKSKGDAGRNGLTLDTGEYERFLETLGERLIELI